MLVAHLNESLNLDFPVTTTVQDVQDTLQHVLNIPPDAVARVNCHDVGGGHLVSPTDVVEFTKTRGHKGVGDHVWTAQEYCQVFSLTEQELQDQIHRGLRVMELANGTIRITETAVDEFISGVKGGDDGSVVTELLAQLKRIADSLCGPHDQQPVATAVAAPQAAAVKRSRESPYLDAQQAADYLGITAKSLYGQVERRRIIPLRGPRRTYRFTAKMLDEYLRRQQ